MNLKQHLIADWHWVLTHSWTARLLALAAVLSGAEVIIPLYSDYIPTIWFASVSFSVTAAAFVARFVLQHRMGSDGSE